MLGKNTVALLVAAFAATTGTIKVGSGVIDIWTRNPARLYRFARKGALAAGMDADLVVLGPDLRLRDVLAGGRWMVRDGEPVVRDPFSG